MASVSYKVLHHNEGEIANLQNLYLALQEEDGGGEADDCVTMARVVGYFFFEGNDLNAGSLDTLHESHEKSYEFIWRVINSVVMWIHGILAFSL